jgi:hypothetical protein
VGFLDRAKKLAEQAKGVAEQAKDLAEGALAEAKSRTGSSGDGGRASSDGGGGEVQFGTPYEPGMLGREGWRERGLTDPAAVLPIDDRDAAGIPRSTRSEIVEEPFGMGRRWSAGGASAGLFYQLYGEQASWLPPTGWTPLVGVDGATAADLPDGRSLVRFEAASPVVLELTGLDDARVALAQAVAGHLPSA